VKDTGKTKRVALWHQILDFCTVLDLIFGHERFPLPFFFIF